MKRTITYAICKLGAILAVAALAVSCLGGETHPAPSLETDRLLLVYMGGDNNLWEEVEQKTAALQHGWHREGKDRLVIFSDTAGGDAMLTEIKSEGGVNTRETVKNYGDVNSADSRIIAQVVSDVRRRYNAIDYGLLVFSHATGWLPAGAYENPMLFSIEFEDWEEIETQIILSSAGGTRTIITDGNSEGEIAMFAEALPDGMFDFIVFEACLMSGVEVAYQLKDKARYILASSAEILSPGFTNAYSRYVDLIFAGELKSFGQEVFRQYDSRSGYERSATLSLIKTSELPVLAEWIRTHCDLTAEVDISRIQKFNRHRNGYGLVFDFYDYYSQCTDPGDLDGLARMIDRCVIWRKATPSFLAGRTYGFDIDRHSGLTTYIPQDGFTWLNAVHGKTDWKKNITQVP